MPDEPRRKTRYRGERCTSKLTLNRQQAVVVRIVPPLAIKIRDHDDFAILAEAVAGAAEVLVTGDRDLLDIAARAPLPIVTPRGLWELLRSNPGAKWRAPANDMQIS